MKKTDGDIEAWIKELKYFLSLREFSSEAKAKVAILQFCNVAKLWWKSYMQTGTHESVVAYWKSFCAEARNSIAHHTTINVQNHYDKGTLAL